MEKTQKVGQEQIHGILFNDSLSWQSIIYDLINTEQLDPWDINLSVLAQRYLEKIKEIEEANFFVSSKVLLAAALLLRIKSEILLNEYIPSLDEILFGEKGEKVEKVQKRLDFDGDIPGLVSRTPIPRFRKISLEELMGALNKAIATETRRIRKVVVARQQEYEAALALPKTRINLNESILRVHAELNERFSRSEEKLAFSQISGKEREEKAATFIPLLHLDSQHKVWLEQAKHCGEIWILLKHIYEKQNATQLEIWKKEVEEALKETETEEAHENITTETGETYAEEEENDKFADRRPIVESNEEK